MIRGYARVSTEEQDLARQVVALYAAGAERIYQDKISGSKFERPELDRLLGELEPGDVVVIQKLDRLGRSLKDLLAIMEIFKSRGVGFRSIQDPIDTTSPVGMFIFQILGAVAEFERELIRGRIKDGMRHKKTLGAKYGRPEVDYTLIGQSIRVMEAEGIDRESLCKQLGISRYKYYQARKQLRQMELGEN